MSRPFLTATWRNLLMANYRIDPSVLKGLVPCGTELDDFNGRYFVSLVGFLFDDTRVLGIAVPGHRQFEEVNLRFYVRYRDSGVWKRGVVFVKEIVPRRMISLVANGLYGERYYTLPMQHSWKRENDRIFVNYRWKVDREWNFMQAVATEASAPLVVGSEEEFITEHYWGYTFVNQRCSGAYQVQHPRWDVHRVESFQMQCAAERLYGPAFAECLQHPPSSVFLAAGSAVTVMRGSRIYATPNN